MSYLIQSPCLTIVCLESIDAKMFLLNLRVFNVYCKCFRLISWLVVDVSKYTVYFQWGHKIVTEKRIFRWKEFYFEDPRILLSLRITSGPDWVFNGYTKSDSATESPAHNCEND